MESLIVNCFSADILTCHGRKRTSVANDINYSSVPCTNTLALELAHVKGMQSLITSVFFLLYHVKMSIMKRIYLIKFLLYWHDLNKYSIAKEYMTQFQLFLAF